MILTGDYHTHTPYSHGKGSVMENTLAAKEMGLKEIGITDHGFSHITFGLRRSKVPSLKKDCYEAEKQTGVRVLVGIESNILGADGATDLTSFDYGDFDLFIAGKHVMVTYNSFKAWKRYFLSNLVTDKLNRTPSHKLVKEDTLAYINAIRNNPVDIISHLNFCCFSNSLEVAKCAEDYGTYIELNSKKAHLTDEELSDIVNKTSVRFVINSDAHNVERVGDTRIVDELIKRVNVPLDRIDNIEGRTPHFRFKEFKRKHG